MQAVFQEENKMEEIRELLEMLDKKVVSEDVSVKKKKEFLNSYITLCKNYGVYVYNDKVHAGSGSLRSLVVELLKEDALIRLKRLQSSYEDLRISKSESSHPLSSAN